MSFLKRLFGTENTARCEPPQSAWGAISEKIATDFQNHRTNWFAHCVEIVQSRWKAIPNPRLAGEVEMVAKVYQCVWAFHFLGQQEYIRPENGKNFTALLFHRVCAGEAINACQQTLMRLSNNLAAGKGDDNFFMASRVAEAIAFTESPLEETMAIMPTLLDFTVVTYAIVANAFGDSATFHKLMMERSKR